MKQLYKQGLRKCKKCKKIKKLSDFGKSKSETTGIDYICKLCYKLRNKKHLINIEAKFCLGSRTQNILLQIQDGSISTGKALELIKEQLYK